MSFCIKPGSCPDKKVFSYSKFGEIGHNIIPRGHYLLGDAGFQLMEHVIIPYRIHAGMTQQERAYNYVQSKARMAVERLFGLFKGIYFILF